MSTLFDDDERTRRIDFLVDRASTIAHCAFLKAMKAGEDAFRRTIREEFESYPNSTLPAPPKPTPDDNPLHVDLDTGDGGEEGGGAA